MSLVQILPPTECFRIHGDFLRLPSKNFSEGIKVNVSDFVIQYDVQSDIQLLTKQVVFPFQPQKQCQLPDFHVTKRTLKTTHQSSSHCAHFIIFVNLYTKKRPT